MAFLAIVAATPEGRVGKYAEYAERADAAAHVVRHGGFVAPDPGAPWTHWRIDMEQKTVTIDPPGQRPPRPESPERQAIRALAARAGVEPEIAAILSRGGRG